MVQSFEELRVWQKAHSLTIRIYKSTQQFPEIERFGITSQIRRSALSVENNIAEGFGRRTKKDFAHFLYLSLGSLYETKSMIYLSRDMNYLDASTSNEFFGVLLEITKSLKKLILTLQ